MLSSLRVRFFIVVWLLLVAGLVGLGALLGRWSTVEINRVSAEARLDRMLAPTELHLMEVLGGNPLADSATIAPLLARAVQDDSMLHGAAVIAPDGRVVAIALPRMRPGELVTRAKGEFEWNRVEESGGHRALIRMVGNGRPISGRLGAQSPYLVLLPEVVARVQPEWTAKAPDGPAALAARFRLALVIGSILAALVTLAISGPLIGRVGALSKATARLKAGDLGARVDVRGSDELANLGRSFNAMAEDLERSEGQRKQMIVDIAHELRTPLTNLTGLIESVQDGLRPPDAATLAALHEETGLLERLVDDLRDLTLADAGELKVAVAPIDVAQVAARAGASFDARHGIVVDVPAEPVIAMADERRLGQVLRNLIQNGVTHSAGVGSVIVAVRLSSRAEAAQRPESRDPLPGRGVPPLAPAALGRDDGSVMIHVSDHGPGIPADVLPRIWDRFYRADASRTRATGGMGLGLPVARRLVEAMGGEITVESVVGEGSVFRVELSATSREASE